MATQIFRFAGPGRMVGDGCSGSKGRMVQRLSVGFFNSLPVRRAHQKETELYAFGL
jgi:hypothetical protein